MFIASRFSSFVVCRLHQLYFLYSEFSTYSIIVFKGVQKFYTERLVIAFIISSAVEFVIYISSDEFLPLGALPKPTLKPQPLPLFWIMKGLSFL